MSAARTIRIDRVHHPVTALGPGRRLGIWVQGCPLACPGCMSRHTWDPAGGRSVDLDEIVDLWRTVLGDGVDGVTVSGGEPLAQAAATGELLRTLADVRATVRPTADILLYTGYSERVARRLGPDAVAATDAMITGRYRADRPTTLIWRGSANQRLIPLSPLGATRYAPYLQHAPERPPMQVGRTGADLWIIGVPRAGDLDRLDRANRLAGIASAGASWTGEPR